MSGTHRPPASSSREAVLPWTPLSFWLVRVDRRRGDDAPPPSGHTNNCHDHATRTGTDTHADRRRRRSRWRPGTEQVRGPSRCAKCNQVGGGAVHTRLLCGCMHARLPQRRISRLVGHPHARGMLIYSSCGHTGLDSGPRPLATAMRPSVRPCPTLAVPRSGWTSLQNGVREDQEPKSNAHAGASVSRA
jgi:hypothetical protein